MSNCFSFCPRELSSPLVLTWYNAASTDSLRRIVGRLLDMSARNALSLFDSFLSSKFTLLQSTWNYWILFSTITLESNTVFELVTLLIFENALHLLTLMSKHAQLALACNLEVRHIMNHLQGDRIIFLYPSFQAIIFTVYGHFNFFHTLWSISTRWDVHSIL